MKDEIRIQVRRLLLEQRWAALATQGDDGNPSVSFVAYATDPEFAGFLLYVSRLAAHTRNLLARPAAALAVSEPDDGHGDPQLLRRITIEGSISVIVRETPDYHASRERYLAKLPQAEQLFGFEDFVLMRLRPQTARYVGGFARAFQLSPEQLRRVSGV